MGTKRFTEEFKIEAVKQITERGHAVAEVAGRLGASTHSLYQWTKRYSVPQAEREASKDQQAELRRLKAELTTRFLGNELSGNFKVISKEDGKFRWQDRCNGHAVYVKFSGASSDTKLCLDYFFWNDLPVGDALSLNLKRSALGDLVVSFGRNG
jgi:transposase-like protein